MQDTEVKDAVDQVRAAAQELHKAISDAAERTGGAAKADLQAVQQKQAKAAADSIKGSLGTQNAATKNPDRCQTNHRGCARGRAESQRSRGGEANG